MDEDSRDEDGYDTEDEAEVGNKEQRASELGFAPQREVSYNRVLPYADRLDAESAEWFARIKTALVESVALRDFRPGLVRAMNSLNKYIDLHGYKFPKEDHVSLVRLFYALVTIPDLEPWLTDEMAQTLSKLLRYVELLTPDDLRLDWRPLYDLFERLVYSPFEKLGLIHFPSRTQTEFGLGHIDLETEDRRARNRYHSAKGSFTSTLLYKWENNNSDKYASKWSLASSLQKLVRRCRPYFADEATREMLDEWRPLMCPTNTAMVKAMIYFDLFLPTFNAKDRVDVTYKLWFDEFMRFWNACSNDPTWEMNMFSLYYRVAEDNIGLIDWNQYIPTFFAKIQNSLGLPVRFKGILLGEGEYSTFAVKWIVATMGNGSETLKNVKQLFQSLESYYHPANSGSHSQTLSDFLCLIVSRFVRRLNRERYGKERWGCSIAPEHKLTDSEITEFVSIVKPVALLDVFSKDEGKAGSVLQSLATLRPELILPQLIEILYDALRSETEPVQPGPTYPEAALHVIPLLMGTLPGIDANDVDKSEAVFRLTSAFCKLIPLVDSSEAAHFHPDLTDVERELCSQTAQFEDFVVGFLDRCFAMIESSGLEATRLELSTSDYPTDCEEGMKDSSMSSAFTTILTQASTDIYNVALRKVANFVQCHIFEPNVAGRIVASLCLCLCSAKPELGLKTFLSPAIATVVQRFIKEDISKDAVLDIEFIFNLRIISQCVRVPGSFLLPYMADLERVLDWTLRLTSKDGHHWATVILENVLTSLTALWPKEFSSNAGGQDRPVQEYLPIREWGETGKLLNLGIQWYLPSTEELETAQQLIDKFLGQHVDWLLAFADGSLSLTKDELGSHLRVVRYALDGCSSLTPFWSDDPLPIGDDGVIPPTAEMLAGETVQMQLNLRGRNLRLEVIDVLDKVQVRVLKDLEDDTNSLQAISSLYRSVVLFVGTTRGSLDSLARRYHADKEALGNKLVGLQHRVRALLINRVLLQHQSRMLERGYVRFTRIHLKVLDNLVTLATSHYGTVRSWSQDDLLEMLSVFPDSYQLILPRLTTFLKSDSGANHEEFKGALHILKGYGGSTILAKPNWQMLETVWPVIIEAKHSEKPSIAKLLEWIKDKILGYFSTFSLELTVPDSVLKWARPLADRSRPMPALEDFPSEAQVEQGLKALIQKNVADQQSYDRLVSKLCDSLESGSLHWRHYDLAIACLCVLMRHDHPMPVRVAKIVVGNLIHDRITVRRNSIHLLRCILKQQKLTRPKVEMKSPSGIAPSQWPIVPGDRSDNAWLCYDSKTAPRNQEQWDERPSIHKTHIGYYTWPTNMHRHVSCPFRKIPEKLNEIEREVYEFFTNATNVELLVRFLSLGGENFFRMQVFGLFKALFRAFGDAFVPTLRPHLEQLVIDSEEGRQRLGSEIVAALVRGTKPWTYAMVEALWSWLAPLLRTALEKMTDETVFNWSTWLATASENMDPNRIHWMLELLMEDPIRCQGSFIDTTRLRMLQSSIAHQEWRVPELLHRMLALLLPHLTNSYLDMRERIGKVLTNVFILDIDYKMEGPSDKRNPSIADFILSILPQLEVLSREKLEEDPVDVPMAEMNEEKREEVIKREKASWMLQIVCMLIAGSLSRAFHFAKAEYFLLLPLMCVHQANKADTDLANNCWLALCILAESLLPAAVLPACLDAIARVMRATSWKARVTGLDFLQASAFFNMPLIRSRSEWAGQVMGVVEGGLEDDRLEVRLKAGEVLAGLIHCRFVAAQAKDKLLESFYVKARLKLPKKPSNGSDNNNNNNDNKATMSKWKKAMLRRHSGIVGLCAFISAEPYDVPDFMPNVLMVVSDHINDPLPIPKVIKETLRDFKRTHQDNWQAHKLKFSEDQLAVLTDVLVSPSYYA